MDPYESPDDRWFCQACGAELESDDCWQCSGAGGWDRHEDDPLWYPPDHWEPCQACNGEGRVVFCPNARYHQEADHA